LLDQLSSTSELINLETAHQVLGTATNQAVVELINCLLAGDAGGGLEQIHRALDTGSDPRQFARQIVEYLRGLLLSKMGGGDQLDETIDIRNRMAQQALVLEKSHLLHLIRAFNQAANELRTSWQPALPLEIAFIEALNAPPAAIAPVPVVAIKAPEKEASTPAAGRPAQEQRSTPPVGAQTQPEASPPVDGESTQAYDQINAGWRNLIDLVNQQSKQTAAILRSAKLLGMRRGVLILGFEGDLLKQKMEAEEHLQRTQRVISEFVSRDILVRCIALRDRQSAIPPDVDIDGMVAAALRDLGGKIVDIQ
jgi:DNA polymerase III subunit gamma/tau